MKTKIFSSVLILAAFVCVVSCSKNDDEIEKVTLDKTSITLYVDETSTLTYSGDQCIWSSDEPLIASVKDGVVKGEHIGTTTVYANDLACSVTVKPKYTSIFEPCIEWGVSQSVIQNYMSGYTLRSSDTRNLVYEGKGYVVAYDYIFESGKLSSCGFLTNLSYSSSLTDFLLERYVVLDVDQSTYTVYMTTIDFKTAVGLQISSSGILVVYIPMPQQSTKSNIIYNYILNYFILGNVKQGKNTIEKNEVFDSLLNNFRK